MSQKQTSGSRLITINTGQLFEAQKAPRVNAPKVPRIEVLKASIRWEMDRGVPSLAN